MINILHRYTGAVLYSSASAQTIAEAVREAVSRSANLQSADLRSADLQSADLRSADLQYANLQYANLQYANLQSADLRSADLQYANLQSANLQSADLWRKFQIVGSAHFCSLVEPGELAIGCEVHRISDWLKNFESIGKANNYSAEQIAEYKGYIEIFAKHSARYVIRGIAWGWASANE